MMNDLETYTDTGCEGGDTLNFEIIRFFEEDYEPHKKPENTNLKTLRRRGRYSRTGPVRAKAYSKVIYHNNRNQI